MDGLDTYVVKLIQIKTISKPWQSQSLLQPCLEFMASSYNLSHFTYFVIY